MTLSPAASPRLLILNGPNLNRLGTREPGIYGSSTLADLEAQCVAWAESLGAQAVCRQSNYEGELVGWVQDAGAEGFSGLVLNPGALTHYSYALRDAVAGQPLPAVEVHLSHVDAREEFRRISVIAPVCRGKLSGFGFLGYRLAMEALLAG